jgi:hypothetical protein
MSEVPLCLVTGADVSHARSLRQFLASVRRHEPGTRTVVYDLGLGDEQGAIARSAFPEFEFRRFNFAAFPLHVDIARSAGQYAWKPVIVAEVLGEVSGLVCWMDAGNVIDTRLSRLRRDLSRRGFFARAGGRAADWTHPVMLRHFNIGRLHARFIRNVDASCVGFDSRNAAAVSLAERWRAGALVEEVIAPVGSDRSNHRQDQALLTMLAYEAGFTRWPLKTLRRLEFRTHQDVD